MKHFFIPIHCNSIAPNSIYTILFSIHTILIKPLPHYQMLPAEERKGKTDSKKHGHTAHSFICYECLYAMIAELSRCNRNHISLTDQNICCVALERKVCQILLQTITISSYILIHPHYISTNREIQIQHVSSPGKCILKNRYQTDSEISFFCAPSHPHHSMIPTEDLWTKCAMLRGYALTYHVKYKSSSGISLE